jgi:alkylation response protein AidB-like acyl-CoA dehydrogenase
MSDINPTHHQEAAGTEQISAAELKSLLKTVDQFVDERVGPRAAGIDREGSFPRDITDAMGAMDLFAIWVPSAYGGLGLGLTAGIPIIERIARSSAVCSYLFASPNDFAHTLVSHGTDAQCNRYLPGIASGKSIGCFAISEPGAGSDVGSIRTSATRDGDDYVIDGQKMWISNGAVGDVFVVFAVTDQAGGSRSISAFVVPANTPGLSIGRSEELVGLHGSPTSEVIFKSVRVPAEALLGEEGDGYHIALAALDEGRLTVAALALGIARGALTHAVRYASEREQFKKPIIRHQGIQFLLAELATEVAAGTSLLQEAARAYVTGGVSRHASTLASMAKLFCADLAMKVTVEAVQIHGASGLSREQPVERMMRDAKALQIFEGTREIQKIIIGRHLEKEGLPLPKWTVL